MNIKKERVMRLYNRYSTYTVVGLVIGFHIFIFGLCGYLVDRFFIKSNDFTGWYLVGFFVIILIFIDLLLSKDYAFARFLIHCKFDNTGIHCSVLGIKTWSICWNSICVYGVGGYESFPLLFFSTDPSETIYSKRILSIAKNRIIFEDRDEFWEQSLVYMPEDMKKNLIEYKKTRQHCFYRRKAIINSEDSSELTRKRK